MKKPQDFKERLRELFKSYWEKKEFVEQLQIEMDLITNEVYKICNQEKLFVGKTANFEGNKCVIESKPKLVKDKGKFNEETFMNEKPDYLTLVLDEKKIIHDIQEKKLKYKGLSVELKEYVRIKK